MVLVQKELQAAYIWEWYIAPTSISLDKSSISLTTVWQTEQLTATVLPDDARQTVTWTSSNTSIATVDSTWLVTCVTPWTCTITATTVNWLTATCAVQEARLPSAYQEVEYIYNTSTWYYIDTWVKAKNTIISQIKFKNLAVTWDVIYGTASSVDNNDYRLFNYSSKIYLDMVSSRIYGGTLSANVVYEFEVWNFYVKNVWASGNIISWTALGSFTQSNILLNGQGKSRNWRYYVKIWDWDTLVSDLVPCYRRLDNAIWMYDLVEWSYHDGGSRWEKWPDVN